MRVTEHTQDRDAESVEERYCWVCLTFEGLAVVRGEKVVKIPILESLPDGRDALYDYIQEWINDEGVECEVKISRIMQWDLCDIEIREDGDERNE